MRYFSYNEPDENMENVVFTMSEEEIRDEYYPWWSERMKEKVGEEVFLKDWSFNDCLDDWVAEHWAWEVKE